MRTETLVLDLSNQSMPRTIAARENDKNGLKVVVNLKERGKTVDLTGYAIKYEAASSNGYFVRSDAVVINAVNGTFEYTFSKESVATRGVWAGYFAFEKGTERYTTPDIKVILGRDVKQGSIEIKDYISEFDQALEAVKGYRKEIDAANTEITKLKQQIAANNVQVGKITQDNGGSTISVSDTSKNILDEIKAKGPGMNTIYCVSGAQGQTPNNKSWRGVSFLNSVSYGLVWAKDFGGKFFTNYMDNGNWLGWVEHPDASMTQNIKVTQDNGDASIQAKVATDDILQMVLDKGRGFHTIYAAGSALNVPSNAGLRGFANLHGTNYGYIIATDYRNKLWTNYINGAGWQGWVNVNGNDKDTDWTPLTLLNGVKQQSSQPASAIKRSGNVVNIVCAITDFKDKQVIANVPAIFRPDREMFFTPNYFQGLALKTGYVIVKPNGDIYLEGIEATVSLYRFALTYIV
ncbi:BppU family phage baseplate upper protein [Bacillus wiedmannii]|uniref:BppU family phage baseplate upper protein n=1 Tax=Bacillus wiedmannii TaxID=1890302 RepID=UPI00166FED28|nr:BppU family phage baseplate upper protein [Bacillus wiedmannii]